MSLDFRQDFWRRRTRVPVLSYAILSVILGLAVFVQLRLVTDGRTERQTKTFKLLYRKFIQDNVCHILSESTIFVEDITKTFWCVISVHSVYRRLALFGHVARLNNDIPAPDALDCALAGVV